MVEKLQQAGQQWVGDEEVGAVATVGSIEVQDVAGGVGGSRQRPRRRLRRNWAFSGAT